MSGLTPLGTIHTSISLVALAAGFACLVRDGRISADSRLGLLYIWATVLTCITGFGIFQHGGFGKPHALAILTLLVIAFAAWPGGASLLGARWRYVSAVSYSFTLFLYSTDDPVLQKAVGGLLALFVAGSVWQVRRLRSAAKPPGALVLPAAGNSLR